MVMEHLHAMTQSELLRRDALRDHPIVFHITSTTTQVTGSYVAVSLPKLTASTNLICFVHALLDGKVLVQMGEDISLLVL
jgi:hypothetical protein